ncbi:MAG TPA: thioredoxin family protein [Oscillatoriales cyanobacterium M59_W2019_021]|nr:MAG: thioredoxin family protein [Cyanobacteria bacterium J055]HIK33932.1 thioredoxin family protein [Oscillatoriales cyanobacterium M4454_W2019_049]HIK51639.1 thioredoxin family protein [Oscillatoriales cyanobacterium M59_W2019_021]
MEKTGTKIGGYAPDFELPGCDGTVHHLARYLEKYRAVCVVFMSDRCPYVRGYLDRLKQLQAKFADRNVTLIGINPNDASQFPEEGLENMMTFKSTHHLNFPYIRDVTQEVAKGFGVQTTPEAFLLDSKGAIQYRGQIDDHADDPAAVKKPYLQEAIDQLLSDREIEIAETSPIGSPVQWRNS